LKFAAKEDYRKLADDPFQHPPSGEDEGRLG
jgi:hypothetical protein